MNSYKLSWSSTGLLYKITFHGHDFNFWLNLLMRYQIYENQTYTVLTNTAYQFIRIFPNSETYVETSYDVNVV